MPKQAAKILDGQAIAEKIKIDLTKKIARLKKRPALAAILVGDNAASAMYVKLKETACQAVGMDFHKYLCNQDCYPDISEKELLDLIKFLNQDKDVDAIVVQLPLPKEFDQQKIINAVDPAKDADGFHPKNTNPKIIPPTIGAIMELLRATGEPLADKAVLIIGKSDIFITGIENHLAREFGIKKITVSRSLPKNSKSFDVVIIALGQAEALKKSMVKPGAIVIDVGINKRGDKTVGDADPKVAAVAGWLSPVPGGVGPLTVAGLLKNTFILSQKK